MPRLTRRRALAAGAAVAATAGLPTPSAAAPVHRHDHSHDHGAPGAFDEVYLGRRIQGRPLAGGHHHGAGYGVFIDGVELHVMRNADGSWISVVSHYDPVPSPRAAARAAVVELRGAPLVPLT
ncbi:tyrosinase family oxidase copper chaperone [Streptomyces sp. Ru72]|uniref:apotyrosinase chaperone MelC1 n=1 Tax=Streptomyces sp. Ru72 TaxID=2080747 RepID=UPI000CDE3BFB|nr:tyrosinase family oxidase copper chaperone [Streptomyces sp. Ru72]POX45386.1 tyrosinase [Streptomyces sp. Ru72]